jgi:hypothetical protein
MADREKREPELMGEDLLDILPDRGRAGPSPSVTVDMLAERDPLPMPRKKRMGFLGLMMIFLLAGGGATATWWFVFKGGKTASNGETPTIHADQRAYKSKPQQPGGMEVPNQDKDVYNRFDPKAAQGTGPGGGQIERLLPSPEKPETPPAPVAAAPPAPPAPPPPALTAPGPLALPPQASPQSPVQLAPVVEPPPPPVNVAGLPKVPEAPPKLPAAALPPPPSAAKAPAKAAAPPAAVKPAAAKASIAGGAYLVQLGALKEESATAKEWARLQKEFADLLGGLSLDVQEADLGAKGTFWRVRGGPLSDADSAKKICEELAKRKQGCMVVRK